MVGNMMKRKTILFQGDSITDAGRTAEGGGLGKGYPALIAARMELDDPGQYQFVNRGVSGNRIVDVYARIKADILNLKPDDMSILIGINDIWHEITKQNGIDPVKFEKLYHLLLEEILTELPQIRIRIMEPFVLEGSATCSTPEIPDRWKRFRTQVPRYAQICRNVARHFSLPFIPLQQAMDEAAAVCGTETILRDGVHPAGAGHELIARQWIRSFRGMER